METTRVVLAQINLLVGDVAGNVDQVIGAALQAREEQGAAIVAFPELTLTGYPPEDLLLRPQLHAEVAQALEKIKRRVHGIDIVVGYPHAQPEGIYNAAAVIRDGVVRAVYHKQHLPNYGVFDEKRYFLAGSSPCVVSMGGLVVGITVCEDLWQAGPAEQAAAHGAKFLINLNASPFHRNKRSERERVLGARVAAAGVPLAYVNLVGGQDELVFDGASFVMDNRGKVVMRAPAFNAGLYGIDIGPSGAPSAFAEATHDEQDEIAEVYAAIVLGTRDYVDKNGFAGVIIGLSGGIDSALTLALAVDALGADRVEAVMLPSRYTATMSLEDAAAEAAALHVHYRVISIEPVFQAYLAALDSAFKAYAADVTEENLQARCRGTLLMALSNKTGKLVLTTGNKSEMAVGYATLYGDMAGGFAPIKDVPKTLVYRLAEYRNARGVVIPRRVFERPPTAELAPDQKDQDSLPPYPLLDEIVELYITEQRSVADIVSRGYDAHTVTDVVRKILRSEYKRRQAPPGVRVSTLAFGRERRYPITSGFTEASNKSSD